MIYGIDFKIIAVFIFAYYVMVAFKAAITKHVLAFFPGSIVWTVFYEAFFDEGFKVAMTKLFLEFMHTFIPAAFLTFAFYTLFKDSLL